MTEQQIEQLPAGDCWLSVTAIGTWSLYTTILNVSNEGPQSVTVRELLNGSAGEPPAEYFEHMLNCLSVQLRLDPIVPTRRDTSPSTFEKYLRHTNDFLLLQGERAGLHQICEFIAALQMRYTYVSRLW